MLSTYCVTRDLFAIAKFLSYSHSTATMTVSLTVSGIFSVK